MKIGIITGNSLRHRALAAYINQEYEVIQYLEESIPNPNPKDKLILDYFLKVKKSERFIFEKSKWSDKNVKKIFLPKGKINDSEFTTEKLDECELIVVFGSSIIKDPLYTRISDKILINLHMGISPEYTGSACNFWAMFDNNIQYVGGTIQTLSKKLDMGKTLKYCYPMLEENIFNPFSFSMQAVERTIISMPDLIDDIEQYILNGIEPDDKKLIRHSKMKDFNVEIIKRFYENNIDLDNIKKRTSI